MTALGSITLILALSSLMIMGLFWWKEPELDLRWRILLFAAIAILPTAAAGTSTVEGLERTTQREFCGSCHVMEAHVADAGDPFSMSLAARHSKNSLFGKNSCYKCHANYGMYGYPLTKWEGMGHVYHYYLGEYGKLSLKEAVETIHINKPYPNRNCMHCHAGGGKLWKGIADHASARDEIESGRISCASAGCHGAAHPFSKTAHKKAGTRPTWQEKAEATP